MPAPRHHLALKSNTSRRVAALICAIAVAVLPSDVMGQAEVDAIDSSFTFHSDCAGEFVSVTGTLHRMQRPNSEFPAIFEHGNWSHTAAIGLTTGQTYRFAASPTNYVAGLELFMNNITLVGVGPDAPTFTVTRSAPTFFGPWEVIQEHCH